MTLELRLESIQSKFEKASMTIGPKVVSTGQHFVKLKRITLGCHSCDQEIEGKLNTWATVQYEYWKWQSVENMCL